jgi:signal transduction histidine kinase/CheY-like chemotaxis protein
MSVVAASELERIRGVARLGSALGEPANVAQLGARVCQLARRYLMADCTAVWIGADPPQLTAASGLDDLPSSILPSLATGDLQRLVVWAADHRPATRVELAPLALDAQPAGLLALLAPRAAPALSDGDLEALGGIVSLALAHLRATRELADAYEKQDREQEQLLRAERMRALGDMALGIAHDFNNVLNAMVAHVGVLAGRLTGQAAPLAIVDKLRRIALDGAATVCRVQEFSGQRRDQEFEDVDLADVVARTVAELSPPPGIQVSVHGTTHLLVRGNAAELGEVARALADNSIESMPSGGQLIFELGEAGDEASLTVSDSGSGMSAQVRRRAFDPFFTTKGSRVKGLGLSVSWGIVRRHGGTIELDSAHTRGTKVRVILPAIAPARAAAQTLDAIGATANANSTRRVLLVEDDPDNREAMQSLLELSGFVVTAADSGTAGVQAFAPDRFDVVVTDLGLPDMDGWQVAAEIKQRSPEVPVALITGWGLNLDGAEIRRRGVDLLVKKPLDPGGFLVQIENLVQLGGRSPSA